VHTLLKILKRWCLISLVERPQRQQKTPPEGINLRTCPRLTIRVLTIVSRIRFNRRLGLWKVGFAVPLLDVRLPNGN
jgi:hypothetical protein